MGKLESAFGINSHAAPCSPGTTADAPETGSGTFAAKPAGAGTQGAGPDYIPGRGNPFHSQQVFRVVPHPERTGTGTTVRCGTRQWRGGSTGSDHIHIQSQLHQFSLKIGTDYVRLDYGIHVLFIDFKDTPHPPQVQLYRIIAIFLRSAIKIPAGRIRLDLGLVAVAYFHNSLYFGCVFRHQHRCGAGHKMTLFGPGHLGQPLESI